MQLDSHHRFLKDWDVELIEMMKQTGAEKNQSLHHMQECTDQVRMSY
jgi:hypothetical protein